ncbi:hypothetical protein AOQ84DRAFT_386229 [Glonium stellatum]|uniref:Uncharacterized protein n=1 Tax=Glonium stellatum TaxID=574774 RepID=A0A8E2F822_9PEZI|nr:hypothetical protein AOQ84DRAFT_386229 [Glonium stellatum]
MGIHGIYKEIGPGERVALSKLAVEKFEQTGRPLRIAIDISIWLFQIQSSKGGTNPALRTFYYRLLRLISLSIHPVFVFDGPNKPPFKRNKRTGPNVASIPEFLAKQLLRQFGLPIHLAPGEAEAECALLQREGIVDAVLSEDVDTLMFGSGITLRNWSPELKSSKTPTHVNLYNAEKTKSGKSGLDREGMILVALMSGGDYIPEGIPGCGPKTACEAARAGFGADLCKISRGDTKALHKWRDRLAHELKTNESKLFKRKHTTLTIPEDFPRPDILGYYTHPAISSQTSLVKLRSSLKWDQDIDFPGLREFTGDAFDWVKLGGAKKFIRNLAPALLVRHLRMRGEESISNSHDLNTVEAEESRLVKSIHGKRNHITTDNSTELRIAFTPIDLVKIDLDKEVPDEELPDVSEDEMPLPMDNYDGIEDSVIAPKKKGPSTYDPTVLEKVWVLETFVRVGVPLKVQDWEEAFRNPKKYLSMKAANKAVARSSRAKHTNQTSRTQNGTIDRFARVTKHSSCLSRGLAKTQATHANVVDNPSRTLPQSPNQPTSSFRMPPAVLESPNKCRQYTVVEVLSSPASGRTRSRVAQAPAEGPLESINGDISHSVTKRRRRPLQRSHTLPTNPALPQIRPSTPPSSTTLDGLDPASSIELPSPSQFVTKKARTTQSGPNSPQTPQARRQNSAISQSSNSLRQTTLDIWSRRSQTATPSPVRHTDSLKPTPAPQSLQPVLEHLDLTLSSPPHPGVVPVSHRTRSTARSALRGISPNASATSQHSSNSGSGLENSIQVVRRPPGRVATPSVPDYLDLPCSSPNHNIPILSDSDSKIMIEATGKSTTHTRSHLTTLPPTFWKTQRVKKRAIALRTSVEGAWEFIDLESSPENNRRSVGEMGAVGRRKRRTWRVSQVEEIDLTGV